MKPLEPNAVEVTLVLLAYNNENYVDQAVEGALSQTYSPLEIILSDDSSTDNTFLVMRDVVDKYQGPHTVRLIRNNENLGLAAHVSKLVDTSKGSIIVFAAGDDVSLPDRVAASVGIFLRNPSAGAVLLSADVIDERGKVIGQRIINSKSQEIIQDVRQLLSYRQQTFGATRAIRKDLFAVFGPLNEDCPTEDTPLLLRSLMVGGSVISSKKGILYRTHSTNLSAISSLSAMNVDKIHDQYLRDIATAEAAQALCAHTAQRLRNWVASDTIVRRCAVGVLDWTLLKSLVVSPSVTLRMKIFLLVNLTLSRLNNAWLNLTSKQ